MNWIDLGIILIIILLVLDGFRAGLIHKTAQVIGVVLGLLVSAAYYTLVGNFLIEQFNIPSGVADAISFLVVFFAVFTVVVCAGSLIGVITRLKLLRVFDRAGGAVLGFLLGIFISGVVLLIATTFPVVSSYNVPVEESRYGADTIRMVEGVYELAESSLSLDIPRLAFNPEDLSLLLEEGGKVPDFRLINFSQLEGATCIACGGSAEFLGYLRTEKGVVTPKLVCRDCGRTSEGCQTYEGHHLLYDRCPAVLGRMGYRTDCGMWPNGDYVRVTGTCPQCGESGTLTGTAGTARDRGTGP